MAAETSESHHETCPSVWYRHVRLGMMFFWFVLTGLDLWVWHKNKAPSWAIIGLALTNVWGWLDAVLRYPVLHDIDSAFTLKNLLLILLKISWLILVFMRKKENPVSFVICSMLAIIMPMFYAMFLPLDETDQAYNLIKSTTDDADIAIRLWRFLRDPKANLQAINRWRNRAVKRGLEEIAERTPSVAAKLGELSPSTRGKLRKPGRCV
eukprot:TRINITY_DN51566_c0_g1_i1.p1 TRINITY_DN51566_c0_g1~~TRINITY_DN51566_c0_g1_i1.p1  ORF type:complete len:209 (-),score=20.83 TRINITY_DN51566_c0_g1_i1:73-699(-)